LEPFKVNVNPGLPTAAFDGLIDTRIGIVDGETVRVNGNVFEMVKSGFRTATFSVPTIARYVLATLAVTCVLETNVVVRAVPFQTIWLPLTKPVPTAVSVNAALPAYAVFGLSEVSVGGFAVNAPETVNGRLFVLFLLAS